MTTGEVEQVLSAARRLPDMEDLALVRVRTDAGSVTAADRLGVRPGDRVVLSRAAQAAFGTNCPADAAVVCVLE